MSAQTPVSNFLFITRLGSIYGLIGQFSCAYDQADTILGSMHYYNILISLFESSAVAGLENSDLSTLTQRLGKTPKEVVSDARCYLETLLRLYYLRHSFDALDTYVMHYFGLLGFMSLNDIKTEVGSPINDKLSLLILCAKGFRDQGRYHYVANVILGIIRGAMRPEDDDLFKRHVHVEEKQLLTLQQIRSQYALNVVGIDDKAENQRMSDFGPGGR